MFNGITIEYFGPAKEFTDNVSKDEIEFAELENIVRIRITVMIMIMVLMMVLI